MGRAQAGRACSGRALWCGHELRPAGERGFFWRRPDRKLQAPVWVCVEGSQMPWGPAAGWSCLVRSALAGGQADSPPGPPLGRAERLWRSFGFTISAEQSWLKASGLLCLGDEKMRHVMAPLGHFWEEEDIFPSRGVLVHLGLSATSSPAPPAPPCSSVGGCLEPSLGQP